MDEITEEDVETVLKVACILAYAAITADVTELLDLF